MTERKQNSLSLEPLPPALLSWNPLRWLSIFGPGAIIASLTIGTGELIFSSRGGALFGYRILFLFVVISIFKWVLVFSTARHMVLTGVHPLRRWLELSIGPRGWLPAVMFVFAALCIPIWVSFHASVLGDLFAGLTGTKQILNGATVHLWGMAILAGVVGLAFTGGYAALERVQLLVISAMMIAVTVVVVLLKPDWLEMLSGAFFPRSLHYPNWLVEDPGPAAQAIASRPIWVEATLYVGVIGGASYDYLAYTSFLRDKRWGLAGVRCDGGDANRVDWEELRRWIRAPLVDCTLSFIVVMIFSTVFVVSGWLVLAPQHQVPGDGNFLEHQAQFVTRLHPWLYPVYVLGTLLAMLGTLYGTLEIGPAITRETYSLLKYHDGTANQAKRLRKLALVWSALGASLVLAVSFFVQLQTGESKPPGLTALLIPASLFTGVLSCGIICLLNPWIDLWLPKSRRPGVFLCCLNLLAGLVFLSLGLKGYWDYGGLFGLLVLGSTVVVGLFVAILCRSMFVR
ncbi:MAG: Nramp family divalent metal transporter [Pirellulaceae bacterium]|nr:Nramp family divalent metal transporter [Pirellulaceae bacterium]